jgi:enamine deaminase RidA (YjgF/YER057c/UK114 family)
LPQPRRAPSITLESINPEDLPIPPTYRHVIAVTGSRLVFVAGQVAEDDQGNLVGSGIWPPRHARYEGSRR